MDEHVLAVSDEENSVKHDPDPVVSVDEPQNQVICGYLFCSFSILYVCILCIVSAILLR